MNMKLTKGLLLAGLGIGVVFLAGRYGLPLLADREIPPLPLAEGEGPGNQVVTIAADRLVDSPPFEAELRQESRVFGVGLSAPGRYLQKGQGSGQFRLELKTSFNEQVATMLRVSDGRFLYSRIALPGETTLTRLDLDQIDQTLSERVARTRAIDLPNASSPWMFGSLPFLLRQLDFDFSFDAPVETQLGETPTWTLRGVWKRDAAERVVLMRTGQSLLDQQDVRELLPEHFPTSVELVLGRGGALDLFPIHIRFLRDRKASDISLRQDEQSLIASIEFQRVAFNVALDDLAFIYDPGEEEVAYRTGEYQQTLRARFPHTLGSKPGE